VSSNAEGDELEEPLFESAPIAHAVARTLCARDGSGTTGCAWYHGSWQYFRALGIVTAPTVHARALARSLRTLARGGAHPRVLISGSADYSLLAHALHAYRLEGSLIDATIVDVCETPCHLSRWYAERIDAAVATTAADILEYHADTQYDVVCTHGFLGNFDADGRRLLLARWHDLLRPGGCVVTVQRIRPHDDEPFVAFSAAEAAAFRDAVRERAAELAAHLDQTPEYLAALAFTYAERVHSHPVRSADELRRAFEQQGFVLERFERTVTPQPPGPRISGPALPGGAEHLQIVAVRR
jgi:SAM-dependent methyltransferase